MIRKSILSKYARSLAEVAVEAGVDEVIEDQFGGLLKAVDEAPDFHKVFNNPVIPKSVKFDIIETLAQSFGLQPFLRDFLKTLIDHNRLGHLEDMLELYIQARNELKGMLNIVVHTPQDLDAAQTRRLADQMKHVFDKSISLDVRKEADLIGGIKVTAGGTVYDGSIKRQLERLKAQLLSQTLG